GNGNDALTVDSSANRFPIPLVYDGGAGADSLTLTGGTASSDTYTPGPTAGSGTSTIGFTSGGGGTQTASFQNLGPMIELVTGQLVVNGTNANKAINYTQGPNSGAALVGGATTGQVSVDAQETIEFANKTTLTINALAGSDTVNLNDPTTPTSLTG